MIAFGPLENHVVRLEPISLEHVDALVRAATQDRSTYDLAVVPGDALSMRAYVEQALVELAELRSVPFAVRRLEDDSIVGAARLLNLEWWSWPAGRPVPAGEPRKKAAGDPPNVAEIGALWYSKDAQHTRVNRAVCRLLLAHTFDVWKIQRMFLKTDVRNERSRTMILSLGAKFEGVLRAHLPAADGRVRDTAMYSILPEEWPAVREHLDSKLLSAKTSVP